MIIPDKYKYKTFITVRLNEKQFEKLNEIKGTLDTKNTSCAIRKALEHYAKEVL